MARKTPRADRSRGAGRAIDPDDPRAAYDAGLRLLARREHSRRELALKLASRRFTAVAIDCGLDSLEADGYLDEQRFVEMLIRHRSDAGYGPLRIRAELASHAVDEACFAKPLAAIPESFWLEQAQRLVSRRVAAQPGAAASVCESSAPIFTGMDLPPEQQARILQALAQRGFPAEISYRALSAARTGQD